MGRTILHHSGVDSRLFLVSSQNVGGAPSLLRSPVRWVKSLSRCTSHDCTTITVVSADDSGSRDEITAPAPAHTVRLL